MLLGKVRFDSSRELVPFLEFDAKWEADHLMSGRVSSSGRSGLDEETRSTTDDRRRPENATTDDKVECLMLFYHVVFTSHSHLSSEYVTTRALHIQT